MLIEELNSHFAKPVLYEVPTYLRQSPIGTLNRKTKRKKAMEKNTWYNFKEKQPPKDAEILVYGNKLEKYAVEYVDSEFETRKLNLNYFQWMLLRNNKQQ